MPDGPAITRRQFAVASALPATVAGADGEARFASVGTYTKNAPGGEGAGRFWALGALGLGGAAVAALARRRPALEPAGAAVSDETPR